MYCSSIFEYEHYTHYFIAQHCKDRLDLLECGKQISYKPEPESTRDINMPPSSRASYVFVKKAGFGKSEEVFSVVTI